MRYEFFDALGNWLKDTSLSAFVLENKWVWPASETIHFIGLALLIGAVGVVDLRMLGIAKELRFSALHRLVRWGVVGFILNLITGVLFFVGAPFQYIHNIAFQLKLLFMLLAGVNVLIFYFTVFRQAEALQPGEDAPPGAKWIAATSLFLWFGVMFWGRMLPFIGQAF